MGQYVKVKTSDIIPSQDFLKENTVRFIQRCVEEGNEGDLPSTPFVRKNPSGLGFIAIDGHNLIADRDARGVEIEVYVAESAEDGLDDTTLPGVAERNQDLSDKFESAVEEAQRVQAEGIESFKALRQKYPALYAV